MIQIDRLSLHLPAGFETRAEDIAREVAQRIALLRVASERRMATLQLQAVQVGAAASNEQVVDAVVEQIEQALEVEP